MAGLYNFLVYMQPAQKQTLSIYTTMRACSSPVVVYIQTLVFGAVSKNTKKCHYYGIHQPFSYFV